MNSDCDPDTWITLLPVLPETNRAPSMYGSKNCCAEPDTWISPAAAIVTAAALNCSPVTFTSHGTQYRPGASGPDGCHCFPHTPDMSKKADPASTAARPPGW